MHQEQKSHGASHLEESFGNIVVHVLGEDEHGRRHKIPHQVLSVSFEDLRHQSPPGFEVGTILMFPPGLDEILEELEHRRVGLLCAGWGGEVMVRRGKWWWR